MSAISKHYQVRVFDGEMNSEFETWLGNAFNSWLPSQRGVEVKTDTGYLIAHDGDTILSDAHVAFVSHALGKNR